MEVIKRSQAELYEKKVTIQIRRDLQMAQPLEKAARAADLTPAQYMIQATRKQLIADGYMPESPDTTDTEE